MRDVASVSRLLNYIYVVSERQAKGHLALTEQTAGVDVANYVLGQLIEKLSISSECFEEISAVFCETQSIYDCRGRVGMWYEYGERKK